MLPLAPGFESSIIGSAHRDTRNLSRSIPNMLRNTLNAKGANVLN